MSNEMELLLETLPQNKRAAYRNLIPSSFRHHYSIATSRDPEDSIRYKIYVSHDEGRPIGIALVKITSVFRLAEIEYFYILPEKRNQGFGTKLLAYIEQVLTQENLLVLQAIYPDNEEWSPYAAKSFATLGYHPPHRLMLDLFFDVPSFRPDWMYKTKPLSKEWEFFLWKDLTEEEGLQIQKQAHQRHFPSYVSPYRDETPFHPETSVGLRYKGEVIGWSITQVTEADMLKYAILYVRPEYHQKGQGVQLLIATLHAHDPLREQYPKAFCEVRLDLSAPSWLKFLEKKVFAHCCLVRYRNRVWKQLNEIS